MNLDLAIVLKGPLCMSAGQPFKFLANKPELSEVQILLQRIVVALPSSDALVNSGGVGDRLMGAASTPECKCRKPGALSHMDGQENFSPS